MLPWNKRVLKSADHLLAPGLCTLAASYVRRGNRFRRVQANIKGEAIPAHAVKRLLVIRPGGLGDAVLTFPMIEILANRYDHAEVDILAESRNADVYTINKHIRRVYCYDKGFVKTYAKLFRRHYDLVVDTEQFHYFSTLLACSLQPTWLCGFSSFFRTPLLTHGVSYNEKDYEVFSFLHLAEAMTGLKSGYNPGNAFMQIPESLKAWAESIASFQKHRPFVTIVSSATSKKRLWPVARYKKIVRWLITQGFAIIILGGKDAVSLCESLCDGFKSEDVLNLSGQTSLAQTAALIQKARAHLSSDTGVLHLACGLGTPTVSLFGSGLHEKWGPKGHLHRVIRAGLPCSPCIRQGEIPPCPYGARCMKEIHPDTVIEALAEIIETQNPTGT